MTALLHAVAAAPAPFLGGWRLLAVPCLAVAPWVPAAPGAGQVPHVRRLPGDWTPQTGGEP